MAYWLAKAQAELGHEPHFLCLANSTLPFAQCHELGPIGEDLTPQIPAGMDVVQLYGTPQYRVDLPYLVNIGGNGQPGEKFDPNTIFVSESHARRHGWKKYVYNGIDLAEYPLVSKKHAYALFLAKAKWRVKNLKGAMRISKQVGIPLKVAGGARRLVASWGGELGDSGRQRETGTFATGSGTAVSSGMGRALRLGGGGSFGLWNSRSGYSERGIARNFDTHLWNPSG